MTPQEEAILAAWRDPGAKPWHHELVKARFVEQWPALARAIADLSATHPSQQGEQHAA